MKKFLCILWSIFILQGFISAENLQINLNQLLNTDEGKERENFIEEILKINPSADTLITLLRNITFDEPEKKGIVLSESTCTDGVKRPFCWYIPETYNPTKKTSLLVYLHGGVSRVEIIDNPEEYVKESPFLKLADIEDYILLFPLGQEGATWWDSVGVANVLSQIRTTKRIFNIDDKRVYMTGFSDGGSGSFFFAMCHPTNFAVFLPLNGHPGVGSIDGGIQTYFVNLFNRPLSVVNTDLDPLYPDKKMRPMMNLAMEAKANLLYRIYTGIGHSFEYGKEEIPLMHQFMEEHPRILNPPEIKWETVEKRHGRCMWLLVDEVKVGDVASWYRDHNMELIDDRVAFGFYPDDTYKGEGIKMGKVIDSTFCALAGAKEGDIVITVGNNSVTSMQVLNNYKAKKKRGDSAEITVLRDGEEIELKGHFPPPEEYMLLRRDKPSARAEASFCENIFDINGSQLGAFTIYIHADMVRLNQNVVIYVNDKLVYDDKVEQDIEFMLRNFLENRDRELLYINKVTIIL
ncbi:MAG: PDZ domain-containing protein [Candidatus Cloacimonadota bacterium]|nr:MAG: PDZ domain-containing protein [Candidatus Cloacimonadota bacterium]